MPMVNDKLHITSVMQDLKMRGEARRDLNKEYSVSERKLNMWVRVTRTY